MTPIIEDNQSLEVWLERDDVNEPAELKKLIEKEVQYVQEQSKNLRSHNKRYLVLSTTKRLVKLFNEYPLMIDGRADSSDNNNVPF